MKLHFSSPFSILHFPFSIFYSLFSLFYFLFPVSSLQAQQPDIQINPNFTWNGENSLGVNPGDPNNLIVSWMKLTTLTQVTIAMSRSTDGGTTWSAPFYLPHFDASYTSADPTLIFSADGTAYFAYIDYNKNSLASGGVYVCKSTDQGATWPQPTKVIDINAFSDLPIDRPWLAIDNSGGTYNGWIYLVTKGANAAPFPHHIYLMASSDGGATWSAPKIVDQQVPVGPQSNSMGVPAVTADGVLSIAYFSYNPASSAYPRNMVALSSDGGNSFTTDVIDVLPVASYIPPTDTTYQYSYSLSASPTTPGELIFIYTDRRNGDLDILSTHSSDGGTSWSTVVRINDDPLGNGIAQDMCWGGYSPDGKFAALWRDRREGSSSQLSDYRIFGTISGDGGVTFNPNFAMSYSAGALSLPIDGNDFLGVAVSDSILYGTWADKRGLTNQLWFNRHAFSSPSSLEESKKRYPERFLPEWIQTDCVKLIGDNKEMISRLSIFDPTGKMALESYDTEEVCFDGLVNGCYIAILHTSEGNVAQKIFLVR
jgi:hypothetical protein